ncbi:MAG: hypothetical protein ACP5KS_09755 [Candidatus Hydrogenedens sp.]
MWYDIINYLFVLDTFHFKKVFEGPVKKFLENEDIKEYYFGGNNNA